MVPPRLAISEGVRKAVNCTPSMILASVRAHATAPVQQWGYCTSDGHTHSSWFFPHGLRQHCPLVRSARPPNGRARPLAAVAALAWPPIPCQFVFDALLLKRFGIVALPAAAASAAVR
eukprot:2991848-Prymnesium_polylepis.1